MSRLVLALAVGLALCPAAHAASNPAAVAGDWWTEDHDGVVQLAPCAAGLCGKVVGITHFPPDGSVLRDNRGRPRCQLQIIPDGRVDGDGVWQSHITNPDDGKTYTITLRTEPDGRLRMRGYIGLPLFGQTVFWTPFRGHLTPDCHIRD